MSSRLQNLIRKSIFLGMISSGALSGAAVPGYCGNVDFRTLTAQTATLLIAGTDRDRTQSLTTIPRSNCGLYGESFPICSSCDNELPESSMQILRPMLGSKDHSDWHARWHRLRAPDLQIQFTNFAKFQEDGAIPREMTINDFIANYRLGGKLAGEDFFYMHRLMIKMVQFELASHGMGCVAPWQNVPSALDPVWPVPKAMEPGADVSSFEQTVAQLQRQIESFKKPENLKKVSLNRLGEMIEPGWHKTLHFFYQTAERCSKEASAQGYCDQLGPVETSPVNKYFWKIHGLVDEVLGAWLRANGYETISTDCRDEDRCYQWQGTWVGKYPTN